MKYAIVSSKKQCNVWEMAFEDGDYHPDDNPPLAQTIAPLSSDGQPIAQAYTLLAHDAGNILFPKKIAPFFAASIQS